MANKVTKMEWSSCQLDYVKEFMCNTKEDVAHLPACCVGSRAYVCENGKWYVCGADQTWKLEDEAMEEGPGEGGGASGGGAKPEYILVFKDDPEYGGPRFTEEGSVIPTFSVLMECFNNKQLPNAVFFAEEYDGWQIASISRLGHVANFNGHDVNAMGIGSSSYFMYVTDKGEALDESGMNEKYHMSGE